MYVLQPASAEFCSSKKQEQKARGHWTPLMVRWLGAVQVHCSTAHQPSSLVQTRVVTTTSQVLCCLFDGLVAPDAAAFCSSRCWSFFCDSYAAHPDSVDGALIDTVRCVCAFGKRVWCGVCTPSPAACCISGAMPR